jgi:hypothetical protein
MFWLMYILGGGLGSFAWPAIVTLGWGIGVFAHIMDIYGNTGKRLQAREAAIQREIEKERSRAIPAYYEEGRKSKRKPKRGEHLAEDENDPNAVRLTGDGELTDSFVEEWDEKQRRKRR